MIGNQAWLPSGTNVQIGINYLWGWKGSMFLSGLCCIAWLFINKRTRKGQSCNICAAEKETATWQSREVLKSCVELVKEDLKIYSPLCIYSQES